ncbi:hypothetical protein [Psychrobacter sp.]|uniref:hypothetical protein n=1 Tax=unclassified Psychrobacter TaxID=196806 RepID=UPI003F9CD4B3
MSAKKSTTPVMMHSFSVDDAIEHGVDAAVMLQVIKDCINADKAAGKVKPELFGWTAKTAEELAVLSPYFNRHKIQRLLSKLENNGALNTGYFNDDARDRTKWYSVAGGTK